MKRIEQEIVDVYCKSIKEIERRANMRSCDYCGCTHEVRLHIGNDMQITPIYQDNRPCQEYMRDLMSEIRALQRRMGLPENIC